MIGEEQQEEDETNSDSDLNSWVQARPAFGGQKDTVPLLKNAASSSRKSNRTSKRGARGSTNHVLGRGSASSQNVGEGAAATACAVEDDTTTGARSGDHPVASHPTMTEEKKDGEHIHRQQLSKETPVGVEKITEVISDLHSLTSGTLASEVPPKTEEIFTSEDEEHAKNE
ncbi:unnamed protein product, partial [Amoebophrya sp. A25]|eukprot:GSA25T00024964001.1